MYGGLYFKKRFSTSFIKRISGVKVGWNAWERRSQARHFCTLAFPGLKERFSRENARSDAGKIVLSMGIRKLSAARN